MASLAPRRVFAILALNSLAHLVLDSLEVKWGNAAYLFAPFSWYSLSAGVAWPESPLVLGLTAWGFIYFLAVWRRNPGAQVGLLWVSKRSVVAMGLLAVYILSPLLFMNAAEEANSHFVKVLRHKGERAGAHVEFDRVGFLQEGPFGILRTFAREEIIVTNAEHLSTGNVSIQGQFVDAETVRAEQAHQHLRSLRDVPSMVGLLLTAVAWLPWLGAHNVGRRSERESKARGR
jgi:hypothetical protein